MSDLSRANELLDAAARVVESPRPMAEGEPVYCGLDVGTAFMVLAAVDGAGEPVGCAFEFADVVRDGMVVDYVGACDIARRLHDRLSSQLGVELGPCAVALPPGTGALDGGAVKNVAQSCGLDVVAVLDEPTAANLVVGATDAAVVDIGGGTTGVSVFSGGAVVAVADESTGGTHFSLVLAGARHISFEEAERYKRDPRHHGELLPVVRPVIDKVASIVSRAIAGHPVEEVVLVGGTSELAGIEGVLEKDLGLPCAKPVHPMFATPLGLALGCLETAGQEVPGHGR
ncbi:ethanolamine utilization protein EutJ [Caniella muris]|uniref:ethanolamine utilization protein EutJ n=1 Tax=Caniella muris TaxID=2941502 RepID=UPI00203E1B37|nr:ethanolamine utilization protein EutJ [Caniella muris]